MGVSSPKVWRTTIAHLCWRHLLVWDALQVFSCSRALSMLRGYQWNRSVLLDLLPPRGWGAEEPRFPPKGGLPECWRNRLGGGGHLPHEKVLLVEQGSAGVGTLKADRFHFHERPQVWTGWRGLTCHTQWSGIRMFTGIMGPVIQNRHWASAWGS